MSAALERAGWPPELAERPALAPCVVDDPADFLSFVCYASHADAEMCVLRDGVRRLELHNSVPTTVLEACRHQRCPVEAALECIERETGGPQDGLDGDVFYWLPGTAKRQEVKRGSLRERLERCREQVAKGCVPYIAEFSRERKTTHHLTGDRSRQLTFRDVRDCVAGALPMWDRGHCFIGSEGVGSCMHVDQAWWSNVGKNFLGYKLVATWGPGEAPWALERCAGQMFRKPLTALQQEVLLGASKVALFGPGDVVSFSGGLPHVTVVVGDELSLTGYESLVNWHPRNAALLLRGAARSRSEPEVMMASRIKGLLDDVMATVERCAEARGLPVPPTVAAPPGGESVSELQADFRAALLQRRYCARRLSCRAADDGASDSLASSCSSDSEDDAHGWRGHAGAPIDGRDAAKRRKLVSS